MTQVDIADENLLKLTQIRRRAMAVRGLKSLVIDSLRMDWSLVSMRS